MRNASPASRDAPSPVRVYGAFISLASGGYAVWRASGMMDAMSMPALVMALVGVIALVHGALLLTRVALREGFARLSGPLMIAYAVVMLGVQAWLAFMPPTDAMGRVMGGRAWDAGMIVLALLMTASGLVMTWHARGTRAGATTTA